MRSGSDHVTPSRLPFAVNVDLKVSIIKAENLEPGDVNCNSLLMLALGEQHNLQNAAFCEESFGKNRAF